MAHTVFDSSSRERQYAGEQLEAHRDAQAVLAQAAIETSRFVEENDFENFQRQSGKILSVSDFERRCSKLVPSLRFDTFHLSDENARACHLAPGSTTRRMYRELPNGTLEYLVAYLDQATIPEFTILLTRTERIPVPITDFRHMKDDEGSWVRAPFINGKDVPASKLVTESDGFTHREFEPGGPGGKELKVPCGKIQGWRTVLVALINYRLCTSTEVEREFGIPDRASWAVRMGRRSIELPY